MDLTGMRFGKLTACSDVDKSGNVMCVCDCGEIRIVRAWNLKNGNTRSCGKRGCRTYEGTDKIFGTSIARIKSKTISKNNKTGVRGVWLNEKTGKYEAYIYFKHRKIHLGCYDSLAEASSEREKAEEQYYTPILMECANFALS